MLALARGRTSRSTLTRSCNILTMTRCGVFWISTQVEDAYPICTAVVILLVRVYFSLSANAELPPTHIRQHAPSFNSQNLPWQVSKLVSASQQPGSCSKSGLLFSACKDDAIHSDARREGVAGCDLCPYCDCHCHVYSP